MKNQNLTNKINVLKSKFLQLEKQHDEIISFIDIAIRKILMVYGYDKFEINAPINFSSIVKGVVEENNLYNLSYKEKINDESRIIKIYLKNKLIATYLSNKNQIIFNI